MIILGGIQQAPHVDYTTSLEGSAEITFLIPPDPILTFHGVSLSGTSPNSATQLLDGAVTPAKISTGGPSWSGVGTVYAVNFLVVVIDYQELHQLLMQGSDFKSRNSSWCWDTNKFK